MNLTAINRPFVLVVLDGWGIRAEREGNAIALAHTPNFDAINKEWPKTEVYASELAVGLPKGQTGNSEVGHQNIGAGRRVLQDYVRINEEIASGALYTNPALLAAMAHVKENNSSLHICGLIGDGGVHAHQKHMVAVLRLAQLQGVERVFIHAFGDGRDTSPTAGKKFMQDLLASIEEIGGNHPAKVATMIGRYYAMDRDNRWERTGAAYAAMVHGEGAQANSALEAIEQSYVKGVTDEFIEPTVIHENGKPIATVQPGDALIHCNYRPDRARQLTIAFAEETMPDGAAEASKRGARLDDLLVATMTNYQDDLHVQKAYPGEKVDMPLAQVISEAGLRQFHTAETEKYAHVTYFINGRREKPFENEDRKLVPSPKVATYDLMPEMSAHDVTDTAIEAINSNAYDIVIMNYANADMVGHTGVLDATIKAIETVDHEIKRIIDAALAAGGSILITADHGKAEQMIDASGSPLTGHTCNPVPVYLVSPAYKDTKLRSGGILADIAPTILEIMGIPIPPEMTGRSLLES